MVAVVGLVVAAAVASTLRKGAAVDDGWGGARSEWRGARPLLFAVVGFMAPSTADRRPTTRCTPLLRVGLCAAYFLLLWRSRRSYRAHPRRRPHRPLCPHVPVLCRRVVGPLRSPTRRTRSRSLARCSSMVSSSCLSVRAPAGADAGPAAHRWLCSLWWRALILRSRCLSSIGPTFVVLGPQLPAFVFGILLGCLHLLHAEAGMAGGAAAVARPLPDGGRTAAGCRPPPSRRLIVALTPTLASSFMISWPRGDAPTGLRHRTAGVAGGRDPSRCSRQSPAAGAGEILWRPMLLCTPPFGTSPPPPPRRRRAR